MSKSLERERFARYWGKANSSGLFHPLASHSLDVVAVASEWLAQDGSLRRALARACGCEEGKAKAWTLFFIGLHDLGKWDARFQLKVENIALQLNPALSNVKEAPVDIKRYNHGSAGYAWFQKECAEYGFDANDDAAHAWMKSVAGHHGSLQLNNGITKPSASPEVVQLDQSARREWVGALRKLILEPAGIGVGDRHPNPPFLIAGFCSVCDWLASNEEFFPYVSSTDISPENYLKSRAENARRALTESGVWLAPSKLSGMKYLYDDLKEQGVQGIVERLPVTDGITIMEAPTGSGKTEAALAYASRLLADGIASGIIFALPTQATANAMLERLEKIATKLFPGGVNVVLAHGKSRANEKFQKLINTPGNSTYHEGESSAQCAGWIAESRKRVFLGQIGVCTIDQVLLSVLPVRHHFVRGFGVQKSVLIVDEAHAYDSYMNGLLDEVLKRQRESGGSAIVLSATLPAKRRSDLLKIWNAANTIADSNLYPLVTHSSSAGTLAIQPDDMPKEREVIARIEYADDLLPPQELLDAITQAVSAGAKVAVICNLVKDAQTLSLRLESECGLTPDVFHSRFRFLDRMEIEKEALKRYGKDQEPGGGLIIATQVIEQSLDLDFDWMLTQICPIDLLFQRIGRLHRHERTRPVGYESPRITVLAPNNLNYGGSAYVYEDTGKLWRTQKLLERDGTLIFPKAYREMIKEVYAEEPWADEPEEIKNAHNTFMNAEEGRRFAARSFAKETHPKYASMTPFKDTEDKSAVLTRDGQMSLTVIPFTMKNRRRHTLNGQPYPNKDDKEYGELVNLNGVPVPESWRGYLPNGDDGLFFIEMLYGEDDYWRGETNKARFAYHPRYGLEMTKK